MFYELDFPGVTSNKETLKKQGNRGGKISILRTARGQTYSGLLQKAVKSHENLDLCPCGPNSCSPQYFQNTNIWNTNLAFLLM